MEELLQAQLNAQRAGVSYAVVTIAEASGSVPRTSGKMLVYADGHSLGTIGGRTACKGGCAGAVGRRTKRILALRLPYPGRSIVRGTAQHSH